MHILSWNCQGLGNPLTIQELRALVAQNRPSLVFLMETKNKEQMVVRLKKKLKFQNHFVVDPIGTAGGLALLWNADIQV